MKAILILTLAALVAIGHPTIFQEMEPNNTPQTANVISGIQHGDMIRGRVEVDITNPDLPIAENDYFSITMGQTDRGLYRNEIWMNENMHVFITEGLRQTNHEIPYLLASRWYSFTGAQPLSFGVSASYTGSPHNYADDNGYRLSYRRARVPESDLGQFQPGMFRFQERYPGTARNRLNAMILDATGRVVPGGLNQNPTTDDPCDFNVNLVAGEYYVLFTSNAYRSELLRLGATSPPMTAGNVQVGKREMMPLNENRLVSFDITTSTSVTISRPIGEEFFLADQDVVLYRMTVVPEPATAILLGGGVAGMLLRRGAVPRERR